MSRAVALIFDAPAAFAVIFQSRSFLTCAPSLLEGVYVIATRRCLAKYKRYGPYMLIAYNALSCLVSLLRVFAYTPSSFGLSGLIASVLMLVDKRKDIFTEQ